MRDHPLDDPLIDADSAAFGSLLIDYVGRAVILDGKDVHLTRSEFELLRVMSRHGRVVFSPEQLLSELWSTSWSGDVNSIEVHISRLRRKLGEDGHHSHFIRTVRGVGYAFTQRPDSVVSAGSGKASRQKHKGVAGAPVVGFFGAKGTLEWVSRSITAMLGWHPKDILGCQVHNLVHAHDHPLILSSWPTIDLRRPQVLRLRMRHVDRTSRLMVAQVTALPDETGGLLGVVSEWFPFDAGEPEGERAG